MVKRQFVSLFSKKWVSLLALAGVLISTPAVSAISENSKIGAFVYTELQISAPFSGVPWQRVNTDIKKQPGFINKTWLAGTGNNSAGGFYVFDSVDNAKKFVTGYFPNEAKGFGVAHTTRVFDVTDTVEASTDMNSVYFGGKIKGEPGAFVYTELQSNIDTFKSGRWKEVNKNLKKIDGLMAKTWLSGVSTGTPGGFYAFETVEQAKNFALEYFPAQAGKLGVAFYTRIFEAKPTKDASVDMNSPFYTKR